MTGTRALRRLLNGSRWIVVGFDRLARMVGAACVPALHLWPWLGVAGSYLFYLAFSSQGSVLAADFGRHPPSWDTLLSCIGLSFGFTLSACLLTSLVLASNSMRAPDDVGQERRDLRLVGLKYIAWAFLLAGAPGITLAIAADSWATGIVTAAVGLAWTLALAKVLRGAWSHPEKWHHRLRALHSYRFLLAAFLLIAASVALAAGATAVTRKPLWPSSQGPMLVPLLGLSACATLYGALLVALPRCTRYPWVVVVAVLTLLGFNLGRQPVIDSGNPLLAADRTAAATLAKADEKCARSPTSAKELISDRARAKTSDPLLTPDSGGSLTFVSAEGGGIRAAYWTGVGLAQLDLATEGAFGRQVTSVSGVSGGSLGIAAWLAARENLTLTWQARVNLVSDFLESDFLSPQLAAFFFLDVPRVAFGALWPPARRDDVLEAALVSGWKQLDSSDLLLRPLLDLCLHSLSTAPAIAFNATDVMNGAPAQLGNIGVGLPSGSPTLFDGTIRREGLAPITVAQAVVMSARFPLLSPAADVGVDRARLRRHLIAKRPPTGAVPLPSGAALPDVGDVRIGVLVDGGYSDNSGMALTRRFIALADGAAGQSVVGKAAAWPDRAIGNPLAIGGDSKEGRDAPSIHVLHFSNDPRLGCVAPGDWRSTTTAEVRQMLDEIGFEPLCQSHIDELENALAPRPLQWLATPLEAILFARNGRSFREMEDVLQAISSRQADGSFVDYSFAAALSRASCDIRPPNQRELCRGLSGGFFGSAPLLHPPPQADPGVGARMAAAQGALAAERDACKTPISAPLPPLGWLLPRDSAAQMRCLASAFAIPMLLKRGERAARRLRADEERRSELNSPR